MKSGRKSGIPAIRIPVAPPGKAIQTILDYDRKRQKSKNRKEIEEQENEMEER